MKVKLRTRREPGTLAAHPARIGKILLRLVVVAVVAFAFFMAWPAFTDKATVVSTGSGAYMYRPLQAGSVLVQPFAAEGSRLGSLALAFERGDKVPQNAEVEIRVRIHRLDAGGAFAQPDQPLFEAVLDAQAIMAYTDTVIPVRGARVEPGALLAVEVSATRLQDTALIIRVAASDGGGLVENGVKLPAAALYTAATYHTFRYGMLAACIAAAAAVLLLAFNAIRPLDRWAARTRYLPLFLSPVLALAMLELLNSLNTGWAASPLALLLAYPIALGLTLLVFFLSRRVFLSILVANLAMGLLGAIHHAKVYFRGDPLFAGDLLLADEAASSLDNLQFQVSPRLLLAVLVLLASLLAFRRNTRRPPRTWRMPVLAILMAAALFGYVGGIVFNDKILQDILGIDRYAWNQMANYKQNGFLLSFAGSIGNLSVDDAEYSPADVAGLYDVPSPSANTPSAGKKPHVIAIMSESYADFRNIRDLPVSEAVMPFMDSLLASDDVISGNMMVSIFGGGTCNTEFEFLTGASMLFLQDGIIPYTNYMQRPTHSLGSLLGAQGYRSVAIHPYIRTFWSRHTVYPNLGFEKFISMETFQDPEVLRGYISDQTCFERVVEEFESTPDNESLFLFSVTMQNHFPYYADEKILSGLDYQIKLQGLTGMASAELYLGMLRKSDDALRYLIEYFEAQDEPVIVVFFGDHLPGNNQELRPFYDYVLGKEIADLTVEENAKLYETPFFIWSNTALPEDDIEVISPNFLGAYVLDIVGARQTPYFEYINSLRAKVPAMNSKTVLDSSKGSYSRSQLPADLETLMDRYWIMEYDNVVKNP